MKLRYEQIIEVFLFHQYNENGIYDGFTIHPTDHTQILLNKLGWLFRPLPGGFYIYARVKPNASPSELFQTHSLSSLKLTFYLSLHLPAFLNYSELPEIELGHELFYFTNLRDEQVNGNKLLGDHISNTRLGNGIELITNDTIIHEFNTPVNSATLTLTDIFGVNYPFDGQKFSLPIHTDKISEYPINLRKISPYHYGRYNLSDNHGGEQLFYYDPTLFGKRVFAVIELFSDTLDFTIPPTDQVPTDYQFISSNQITGKGKYAVLFPSRNAKWKFVIRKKPGVPNGINMNNLRLGGDIPFPSSPVISDGKAVFQSVNTVLSRDVPYNVLLSHSGTSLFKLPNPAQSLQLQKDNIEYYYEINIYV